MRVNKSKNRKLIYRQFLVSYILILVLPITLGSIVYYKALDIIEKDAREARMFMLKQSSTLVDNYLRDVERVTLSISLDPSLQRIIYMDPPAYGSSDIYNVTLAQKALASYSLSTSFDSGTYVFLNQPDIVFANNSTQKIVQFGTKGYFDNNIQYGDLTYDQWYHDTLSQYHSKEILPAKDMHGPNDWNTPINCIAYIQSLPLGGGGEPKGVIEVLINTGGIKKLLEDVDESKSGWTYIQNEKGQIITGVTNGNQGFPTVKLDEIKPSDSLHQKINGAKMTVLSLKSSFNNWEYVTILPESTVMTKANYIKGIILVIVVSSLASGLLISYFLAKRNTKPIHEVILTLRSFFQGEMERGRNEYDILKDGIGRLINVNEEMKTTVDNQAILLKSSFVGRLIKGEFSDATELDMQRKHLDVGLDGKWFSAAIVSLHAQNDLINKEQLIEQDISRLIISRTLNGHIGKAGYTYFVNTSLIAVVMSFAQSGRADCMERAKCLFEEIKADLADSYSMIVDFYVGNPYERLIDVSLSYNEAVSLLEHFSGESTGRPVVLFWEEKLESSGYFYPLEIEQKLINMASAGNKDEITRALGTVYAENFEKRILSAYMKQHLLFDIKGTILKATARVKTDIGIKELLESMHASAQPKELFDTIRKAYCKICETASNRKKSHNSDLLERLMAYIGSHYASPDISVSSVASEFNISESYLSQFIKEQTGEPFSDHVEGLRIRRACELLSAKGISIEDVARLTGYNSAYSFRRAFKRVNGVLPTEYNG